MYNFLTVLYSMQCDIFKKKKGTGYFFCISNGIRPFGVRHYPRECHRRKSTEKYLISMAKRDPKDNQGKKNSSSDWQGLIPKSVQFRPEKTASPLFYFLFSSNEIVQANRINPSLGRCFAFYYNICHNSSRVQEMFFFFFY